MTADIAIGNLIRRVCNSSGKFEMYSRLRKKKIAVSPSHTIIPSHPTYHLRCYNICYYIKDRLVKSKEWLELWEAAQDVDIWINTDYND